MDCSRLQCKTYNLNLWFAQKREPGVMKQVKAQKKWSVFLKATFNLEALRRAEKVSNMRATDSS